jgi:hypothetical protein
MAPGHMKKTAKKPTTSAKTFAPGHGGKAPGQTMTK